MIHGFSRIWGKIRKGKTNDYETITDYTDWEFACNGGRFGRYAGAGR